MAYIVHKKRATFQKKADFDLTNSGEDTQARVNIGRVIQLLLRQTQYRSVYGSLTLRFRFRVLICAISSLARSNKLHVKFSLSLSLLLVLGMTAIPRCVAHLRSTCAGAVKGLVSGNMSICTQHTFAVLLSDISDKI